jgi:hypothetical protein
MTPSPTFLKRLKQLDPALQLRWSATRGQWSVERLIRQSSKTLGIDPSPRDLYYWGRGRLVSCALVRTPAGVWVSAEEIRLAPTHLCWWGGPLDQSLIDLLQSCDAQRISSNPVKAFDTLIGQPAAAAEASTRRASLSPLAEMRREMQRELRRAAGQSTTVALSSTTWKETIPC